MPFDASTLWWPVLSRLYDNIIHVAYSGGAPPEGFDKELEKREPLLLNSLGWFKHPSKASRDALTSETYLEVGGNKKIPIAKDMVEEALELSLMLGLDEVQAYILLRRALAEHKGAVAGRGLSGEQRLRLLHYYWRDRLYLLKCTEALLDYGLGKETDDGDAPLLSTLKRLLGEGLKGEMCSLLTFSLKQVQDAGDVLREECVGPAPPAANMGEAVGQAMREAGAILDNLLFCFSYASQTCSLERWDLLARTLRPVLVLNPSVTGLSDAAGGAVAAASAMELRRVQLLGSMVLLGVLDLNLALQSVAEGQSLSTNHPFAGSKPLAHIDKTLQGWWGDHALAEAAVLLAWAAFTSLALSEGSGVDVVEPAKHAEKATGGLGSVAALTEALQATAPAARVYREVLQGLLAGIVTAFRVSPLSLGPADLEHVRRVLAAVYQDSPEDCARFWITPAALELPLHNVLHEARALFPAVLVPLLSLLGAVTAGGAASEKAFAYLGNISHVAVLHRVSDPRLGKGSADSSSTEASEDIPVPGIDWFKVPAGSKGEFISAPPAAALAAAVLGLGAGGIEEVVLVQWQLSQPPPFTGIYFLRARMSLCVRVSRQGSEAIAPRVKDLGHAGHAEVAAADLACAELAAAMQLLACFGKASPAVALQLLQLDYEKGRGSLLDLALEALDVLSRQSRPPLQAMGDCLAVVGSLASTLPAAVLQTLENSRLLTPDLAHWGSPAAPTHMDMRIPGLQALTQGVESAAGAYPVTLGFLEMVATLVASGVSSPTLQAHVAHVIGHVLGGSPGWRYARRSQRWDVVAVGLRVLRAALQATPNPGSEGDQGLAAMVVQTLSLPGALEALLFGCLPPDAGKLEAMVDQGLVAEVAAADVAVQEWLVLIPLLLPALPPVCTLSFLQVQLPEALSPAQSLASYITYNQLAKEQRAQGFETLLALCEGSARAGHKMAPGELFTGSGGNMSRRMQTALLKPFRYQVALHDPTAFEAAARLLECALSCNPGLAHSLLLPPGFSEDGFAQATPPAQEHDKPAKRGGGAKAQQHTESALDGLWAGLKEASRLRAEQPRSLAALLRLLLAMWQAGGNAYRPLQLLRQQAGFWEAVGSCLPDPGDGPPLPNEAAGPACSPQAWHSCEGDVWRVSAEGFALQLISAEAFSFQDRQGSARSGVWDLVESWTRRPYEGFLPLLLVRYGGPCQGNNLLEHARIDADKAAVEILRLVLQGEETVGRAFLAPGGFLRSLAAEPGGGWETLQGMTAGELKRREAGRLLMSGARAHSIPSSCGNPLYGQGFLYSAATLTRRCGELLPDALPALHNFLADLQAVSVMASFEEARLAALRALHTTLALTLTASHVTRETLGDSWDALRETLLPFVADVTAGRELGEPSVISTLAITFDATWQVAQCALMLLRKWSTANNMEWGTPLSQRSNDDAAALAEAIVDLARVWLEAERILPNAETLGSVLALSGTLIAGALIMLRRVGFDGEMGGTGSGYQETLVHLVIALAGFCQRPGPNQAAAVTLLVTSRRSLPHREWLHAMDEGRLNMVELLDGAVRAARQCLEARHPSTCPSVTSAQDGNEGDAVLGSTLLLLLEVAQTHGGARILEEQGFMRRAATLAQHLLWPPGPGSQSAGDMRAPLFGALEDKSNPTSDHWDAYLGNGRPNPAQQHWCSLVSLVALQLRAMIGVVSVRQAALTFLLQAEDRLSHSLFTPDLPVQSEGDKPVTIAVTLSLAMLQELERSCFFLTALVGMRGEWQVASPQGPFQACCAAAKFVTLVAAAPALPDTIIVACPPVSSHEKALAEGDPEVESREAWFGLCAEVATVGDGAVRASAYSVRLAEQLYSGAAQALSFLCLALPQVSQEEAAWVRKGDDIRPGLSPSWPLPEALVQIQKQANAISMDLKEHVREHRGPRASRVAGVLLSVLRSAGDLLERMYADVDSEHKQHVRDAAKRLRFTMKGPDRG